METTSKTFFFEGTGRRDLTTYERSILALKLKPVIAAKAKENLVAGAEMTNTGLQKSVKAINTQQEVAKLAGVSHDTIAKVEKIEVGKRLIQAKALVQHGQWQAWLEKNFQLKDRMAQNFMACAERFGKTHLNADLNQTQLITLLSLPSAEETEKFIEAKAAEGKRVADMTIKQLRAEIADYKKAMAMAVAHKKIYPTRRQSI